MRSPLSRICNPTEQTTIQEDVKRSLRNLVEVLKLFILH